MFNNKNILIIGGTGTLGQELTKQLLNTNALSIRIMARHEHSMFKMKQEFKDKRLRWLIGDIRDLKRLNRAFENIDIVINAAALKHVELCLEQPYESLETNVVGVQNAIDCALNNNIDFFVQISTDKAVNPCSTYGYTKALAEDLTLNAINYQGVNRTKFAVIRSGNIMNSSGSCFEVWEKQYKNKEKLTITDLAAVRYMDTKENIASKIIDVIKCPKNGVFVLKMPKYTVGELIARYPDCYIELIGLKKGEKLVEDMVSAGEKFEWR